MTRTTQAATPHKTWKRCKSLAEIEQQCKEQDLALSQEKYQRGESDYVTVSTKHGTDLVLFCPFNGRFFGHTDQGVRFSCDDYENDNEPWFQALLEFFSSDEEAEHG